MVNNATAPTNHSTPLAVAWYVAPRATAATISTVTCNAVIVSVAITFANGGNHRGNGAARSSRSAPCSRSAKTLRPENIAFSGTSKTTVATETNVR